MDMFDNTSVSEEILGALTVSFNRTICVVKDND